MAGQRVYRAPRIIGLPHIDYYGFLDARDTNVTPPEPTPGEGWPADFRWSDPAATRIGFSAVPARKFLQLTVGFGATPARPSPAWREGRRERLQTLFDTLPVYRIDVFTPSDAPQGLQTAFRLGGWFMLTLSDVIDVADPAAGLFSRSGEDAAAARSLRRLRRVSPEFRDRLRRVFSLDHVGDLGTDGRGGAEPTPTPPKSPPLVRVGSDGPKQFAVSVFGAERLKGSDRDRVRQTFQSLAPQDTERAAPRPRQRLRIGGPE